MVETSYERDFHAWAFEQARRVRAGEQADSEHIAEELEGLGRSQQNQLVNRLAVLLSHLLKWEYQPDRRTRSWTGTIREQRLRVNRLLRQMPSLRATLPESLSDAYEIAVTFASAETGIIEDDFPAECPYGIDQVLAGTTMETEHPPA